MASRSGTLLVGMFALLAGCASAPASPPDPGEWLGGLPALRGQRVMVLPIQRTSDVLGAPDAELLYALEQQLPGIEWVGPAELERARGSVPVMDFKLDQLPIDAFFQGEVTRVGDPVYGILRRTAALTDADVALIPLALTPSIPSETGPVDGLSLLSTLLDVRSGRVFWLGTAGAEGDVADPGTLAGVMEELARSLLPAGGGLPR